MKALLVLILTTTLFSCSTRTCSPEETVAKDSSQKSNQPVAGETKFSPTTNMNNTKIKKIKVYKPDGSVQCEQGTGTPVATMAQQLVGVTVFSSENKHDGLIRIQMCGQPTGQCNVYEIAESDFEKASQLGFKKWKIN